MSLKIISEKENPFLERREMILEIASATAPTFLEVKKMMLDDLKIKSEEDSIVVRKVSGTFGKQSFEIEAFVYNSPQSKEKIEVIPKKIKKKIEAEKKAAEEAKKKAEEEAKKAAEEAKKAEESNEENTMEKTE